MAHVRLSHFTLLDPRLAKKRQRTARKLRPIGPSQRVRLWYREQLGKIVDHLRAAGAEYAEKLRPSWQRLDHLRAQTAGDARRGADETDPKILGELAKQAAKFGDIELTARRLTDVAERMSLVRRGLASVDEALIKEVRRSIGVDVGAYLDIDAGVRAALREASDANVALIKSIPPQYFDQVRETVEEAFTSGLRWEEIVPRIRHIGDVTTNRAKLIARDQTAKMTSSFNQVRQTQVGIEQYTWSGALDARERPSHRAMEGSVERWAAPPEVDGERVHPGQAINCRCVAVPVFNLDELTGGGTEQEREAA